MSRLEGVPGAGHVWERLSGRDAFTLTQIPAGHYTLHVQVEGGTWLTKNVAVDAILDVSGVAVTLPPATSTATTVWTSWI